MDDIDEQQAIAHVHRGAEGGWRVHRLSEHLESTARIAGGFAAVFGNADWAEAAGGWHDFGKYKPAFQAYIRSDSGYDPKASIPTGGGTDHTHATAGAVHAAGLGPAGRVLAYLIAGHHGGLPDWSSAQHRGLEGRLADERQLRDALAGLPPEDITNRPVPTSKPTARAAPRGDGLHLWVRMLFSCLVDADFLDTEAFMAPGRGALRTVRRADLAALSTRFDTYMASKRAMAPDTPVNRLRNRVLEDCRAAAAQSPGMFSLTVPTGGGKTFSSMAFALAHALRHGKRRIIVAIPYTSIIEQTAEELRKVFGNDAVLEHHSNFDPEREHGERREITELASENWDAPIIVTTNVQMFESLFASRTSACRKLHNIVDSVVILDEAQMLPPEYLKPILSVLQTLTNNFGVSVVLCTATQPALSGSIGTGEARMEGLTGVRELMPDPGALAGALERARIRLRGNVGEASPWEDLAPEIAKHERVLCVVNTRKDCRQLHALMPEGTIHLSALLCAEHRSEAVARIKALLAEGAPVRVVSTQLVEAGVDIDFPVVYRALAGLDSIAQAAGRCNREGRLNELGELGEVVVFMPPKAAPSGLLRKGQDAGAEMLRCFPELFEGLQPAAFSRYFELFYALVKSFDTKEIQTLLAGDAQRGQFEFRTAAERFKLIDDTAQRAIIVWWASQRNDSTALIEELRRWGPTRALMRKLQRFSVNIPVWSFAPLVEQGAVEDIHGVWVQAVPGLYDDTFGLRVEGPAWTGNEFVF